MLAEQIESLFTLHMIMTSIIDAEGSGIQHGR